MSYTARPPFASGMQNSGQNQQQQGQSNAPNIAPGAVPNMSMMNNPASTMQPNYLANPSSSSALNMIEQQKILQQQLLLQTQLILQQQQQQQTAQTQQAKFQQQTNPQALNRFVNEMQKNGNVAQQLAQIQALSMLQQQVQAAQQSMAVHPSQAKSVNKQAAHQQKSFPQQSMPLPSNTTITPVGRQNMQAMQKPPTSYPRSNVPNRNVPQNLNATQSRKNQPIAVKPPSIPPGISSSLNISTVVTPKGFADTLAAKQPINFQPTPNITPSLTITKTSSPSSSTQMTKSVSGLANRSIGNNALPANIPSMPKPLLPEAISMNLANAAFSAQKQPSHAPSVSLAAVNTVNVSPMTKNLQITPQKSNVMPTATAVQKLSPTSPRTKQTPRKNTNPIKTTASPATLPTSTQSTVPQTDAKVLSAQLPPSTMKPVTSSSVNAGQVKPERAKAEVNLPAKSKSETVPKQAAATAAEKVAKHESISSSNGKNAPKIEKPQSTPQTSTKAVAKSSPSIDSAKKTVDKMTAYKSVAEPTKVDSGGKTPIERSPQSVSSKSSEIKAAPSTPVNKKTPVAKASTSTPVQSSAEVRSTKRNRLKTIPYQSPTPEFELVSKISAFEASNSNRNMEEKLTLFYKNEFLAVRNADGGFFLCQTMYNVYKTSPKIRIRWLSEEASNQNHFALDFYDSTDMECILTSVTLNKLSKGKFQLTKAERDRIENILKRALDVEKGIVARPEVTEENPDGLDISLYKDESQIEKKSPTKRQSDEKSQSVKKAAQQSATKRKISNKAAIEVPPKKAKKNISQISPAKKTSANPASNTSTSNRSVESTPTSKRVATKRKLADDKETEKSDAANDDEATKVGEPSPKTLKESPKLETTSAAECAAQSGRTTRRSRN